MLQNKDSSFFPNILALSWWHHAKKLCIVSVYKGPTVTLVKDKHGAIFGGFASQPWERHSDFYGDMRSFLLTLAPSMTLHKPSGTNTNIQWVRSSEFLLIWSNNVSWQGLTELLRSPLCILLLGGMGLSNESRFFDRHMIETHMIVDTCSVHRDLFPNPFQMESDSGAKSATSGCSSVVIWIKANQGPPSHSTALHSLPNQILFPIHWNVGLSYPIIRAKMHRKINQRLWKVRF